MAAVGRLSWWVEKLIIASSEEEAEQMLWDMYVRNPFEERSFEQYKRDVQRDAMQRARNQRARNNPKAAAQTVEKSRRIIESFGCPVEAKI